jgi:hypothetical protein
MEGLNLQNQWTGRINFSIIIRFHLIGDWLIVFNETSLSGPESPHIWSVHHPKRHVKQFKYFLAIAIAYHGHSEISH